MDETDEELEQIRRDAAKIDVYKYRKRFRFMAAVAVGALGAGVVFVVMMFSDRARNPCERLRAHYCSGKDSLACATYDTVFKDSVEHESAQMRGVVREGCVKKINRLKTDEGIVVP